MSRVTFILDVDKNFDSYEFFSEFKKAQYAGIIKNIESMVQLDRKKKKEITYQDLSSQHDGSKKDDFVISPEMMEKYGVK